MPDDHVLWEGLKNELEAIVRYRCPGRSEMWRDDVVQEALLRLRNLLARGIRQPEDFESPYLHRVAHSVIVNTWHRERRRREAPLDDDSAPVPLEPGADPEAQAVLADLGSRIARHLRRLSPERRLAVQLCVIQGHRAAEAAAILGFSVRKTENLVFRGRQQLRRWLSEELETAEQDDSRERTAALVLLHLCSAEAWGKRINGRG